MLITAPHHPIDYESNYSFLRNHKDEYQTTIDYSTACINPTSWMAIMPHKDALSWLRWVNNKICLHIDYENFETIGVKLRIATGMLNKLESLTDLEKIQIHSNLVRNIHNEYYNVQLSRLPF